MRLGIDPSTYEEVLASSPRFTYHHQPIDPLSFFRTHSNVDVCRLRLWVDPYDEKRRPYHGGTSSFASFIRLAKMAAKDGYEILLDLQYSDFWCDPSKQTLPKSWQGLSSEGLAAKVYSYTLTTLLDAAKLGVVPSIVQIGNEVTNGMLWPSGALTDNPKGGPRLGYDTLTLFLKKGAAAVRKALPQAKVMIHLERSGNLALNEEFFLEVTKRGLDYDLIGLSYYPFWHGPFSALWANVDNLATKFRKPLWIVETGYGFSLLPSPQGNNLLSADFLKESAATAYVPFPLTQEGQRDFLVSLLAGAQAHSISGVIYWEPMWLPLPGLEWASLAGEAYLKETTKPTGNEWANQCLFDYEGEATLGFDAFRF